MKSSIRSAVATAALAAGLAFGAAPALAWDTVNWTWTSTRTDTSTNTSTSTLNALPTGDMAVQARQIYVGDVRAESDATASVVPTTGTPLEATNIGHVESGAAAYANVYTAASEVPLSVDLGQYHVGTIDPTSGATPTIADPTATNANYAYADALIADSANGLFTPHETSALATATGVVDATASTDARAVSNTASLELAAAPAESLTGDPTVGYVTNALMSADLTQLSVGRTDALAVTSVSMANVGSFTGLDRPIASASATAIGNLGTATTRIGTLDLGL
ncbi:hypothetical protein [Sphingopyxis sp.]|uniref:hypothetical protein n=1 Tax=Sphingopyxis sp. TaxID=1908224 RepID=UPI002B468A64|nr:hypothetical protein [Sphingopyxis sp.]HJS10499.1 hypothetical protein [Sphingopyxis sp.]HKY80060.1 hypothetical protein [Sphingobium sp.]